MAVPGESAVRAAKAVDALHSHLTEWFNFFNGYDPLFSDEWGCRSNTWTRRFGVPDLPARKGSAIACAESHDRRDSPDCRGAGTKIFHRPGSS